MAQRGCHIVAAMRVSRGASHASRTPTVTITAETARDPLINLTNIDANCADDVHVWRAARGRAGSRYCENRRSDVGSIAP
jgi:hypothetical protein